MATGNRWLPCAVPTSPRGAAAVAVAAAGCFWAATLVGAALNPGYRPSRDYVSSLASYGARTPVVGVLAIAVLALAHAATAVAARRALGVTLMPALLMLGSLAGLITSAFRIHCSRGVAGCSTTLGPDPARGLSDAVHGTSVAVYAVTTVVAMMALAWACRRRVRPLALASIVAAVASSLSVSRIGGAWPGGWQRLWLGVNVLWLLAVVVAAVRSAPPPRAASGRRC